MKRLIPLTLIALACHASACTLWGAAGNASAEGTLLAKNRDWLPDHVQVVRLKHPANGLAYLGLYALSKDEPGIKEGVNEAGLSVVAAEASSLPRAERDAVVQKHHLMTAILARYRTLDEVVADASKLFTDVKPVFLLLADANGLMRVEVGQGGRYTIKRSSDGILTQTNYYLDPEILTQAQKIGPSNARRYTRINTLLADNPAPHTLDEFTRLSVDRHDGPENSLWRSGHYHTLAGWQISLPRDGAPHLHLLVANPGAVRQTLDLKLDKAFWAQPEQDLTGTPVSDAS